MRKHDVLRGSIEVQVVSHHSSPSDSQVQLLTSAASTNSVGAIFPLTSSSYAVPFVFLFGPNTAKVAEQPSHVINTASLSACPSS